MSSSLSSPSGASTTPAGGEANHKTLPEIFAAHPALESLVSEARSLTAEIQGYRKRTHEGRLRMGYLLDQIAQIVAHGEFEIIVIEKLGLAKPTAWNWRKRYLRAKASGKVSFETFDSAVASDQSPMPPPDPASSSEAHAEELANVEAACKLKEANRRDRDALKVRWSFQCSTRDEALLLKTELSRVRPTATRLLTWLEEGSHDSE